MTLTDQLSDAIQHGDFVMLVLSRALSAAEHKVTVKPVDVREGRRYQWTTRAGAQERHENLTAENLLERVGQAFGTAFGDAHLFTKRADITARVQSAGKIKWKTKPPSKGDAEATPHNREKNYLIPSGKPVPFLARIGVMTATWE